MFVIHVIPLIKGTQLESLSYFSSISYPVGSFVLVPVRGKTQSAIVTDAKPVSTTKTALKAATFSLRKLPAQPEAIVLPESVRQTAEALATTYPVSVGALLYTLLPPDVRNGVRAYPAITTFPHSEETAPQLLTARLDERLIHYKSHIRSAFAHRGSVLLVVPTTTEIIMMRDGLKHGIEERLVVLSSKETKRERDKAFLKLADTSLSKLIITTPAYAFIEHVDLTAIIVEQSASSHFKNRTRPYLDYRDALITYARLTGRSIILGDTVPRTEDEVHRRNETYLTCNEEVKRIAFTAPLTIVTQKDKPQPDVPFKLFSTELLRGIERTLEAKGRVFLFAARRGLAPVVACIDCGYIFRCPDSNTPYSLIRLVKKGVEERWFVAAASGRRVRASDVCPFCGSWRLRERGIGIQYAYDELRAKLPNTPITLLDQDSTPTAKKVEVAISEFFANRSGILLGTQLAIPHLHKGVDFSAIISLDATRAVPTWRADESLFRLLLKLRECSTKEVLVQTRSEVDTLLTHAQRGAIERFYDDEITLRQMLNYPPFANFILLSFAGTTDAVKATTESIKSSLGITHVEYYHNPNSTSEKTVGHALVRISSSPTAKERELFNKIKALPPFVKIEVNPERIV